MDDRDKDHLIKHLRKWEDELTKALIKKKKAVARVNDRRYSTAKDILCALINLKDGIELDVKAELAVNLTDELISLLVETRVSTES